MQFDENFYRAFLEEVNNLEKFRMAYSSMHASDLLGRDDPDVKRLIQSMAFFSTRNHLSALRNIQKTLRRLFEQYFSFLLTPLPATGILQCEISGRFVEPTLIPKNSEVFIAPPGESYATFRTMDDLRILPITLSNVEMLLLPKEGFRMVLHFQTPYPRNDQIGSLKIYLNYLNNYYASLQFQHALRKHLKKASVVFDEVATESSLGLPCSLTFGSPLNVQELSNVDILHPLQQIRSFFHFPQQELYAIFQLPAPPRNWKKFTICLDVDKNWPKSLTLNPDIFQLFTVPIVNLKHCMARPIVCDGMHDRYPIYYGEIAGNFDLHSPIGVYQIEKEGLLPMRPGIFAGGSGSYEIEHSVEAGTKAESWLMLNLPEAFTNSKKIAVDAVWYQPWFSKKIGTKMDVQLYGRNIQGVVWDLAGELRPHQENALKDSSEALLQMLSLQKKPVFHLDEIICLLNALGVLEKSHFREIPKLLIRSEVSVVPQSRKIGGMMHLYQIELKDFDPNYRPVVEVFMNNLARIISVCSADSRVALKVKIPGTGEILDFE